MSKINKKFPLCVLDAPKKEVPNSMKFVNGGLAGMLATCLVHPLDFVKTRMQVAAPGEYKNPLDVIMKTVSGEGIGGVYKGLSAGLLRQATYTTSRMGSYQYLLNSYSNYYNKKPNLGSTLVMGIIAGAIGAAVGTPAELLLIRMMADGKLPPEQRRNYKGLLHAFSIIIKEEGVLNLWRGCTPTVVRAMIVNMAQLASYTQFKTIFKDALNLQDGLGLHFLASITSGFITSAVSMPVDMVKTKIQNMKIIDGKPEYSSSLQAFTSVLKNDGVFALWRGFVPYFLRIGPHTIFTFIFLENLNKAYSKYILGGSGDSGL